MENNIIPHVFNRRVLIAGFEYDSIRIASTKTEISYHTILSRLKNPKNADYKYLSEPHKSRHGRRVVVDDTVYDSISECSRAYSLTVRAIKNRIASDNPSFVSWEWFDAETMTTV